MRSFVWLTGLLTVSLIAVNPAFGIQSEYQTLRDQIDRNEPIDTELIRTIPEPSTDEEHWLRSFTRTTLPQALSDVKTAIRLTDSPSKYLKTWLDLALLDDPNLERLKYLRGVLRQHTDSINPVVWLQAGKYAGALDKYDLARRWGRRALVGEKIGSEARLDLAEYELASGNTSQAREYLDEYLLKRPERTADRYWMLRGRLFRSTQSDSEAYLAYSHLVRNYPNSLLLDRAESRLRELPLPDAFKPGENGGVTPRAGAGSGGLNDRSDWEAPTGGWLIQLASFQDRSRARRYRRRMESTVDGDLMINSVRIDGTLYYRVQLAGFETRQDAQRRQRQLERDGINTFILDGSRQ